MNVNFNDLERGNRLKLERKKFEKLSQKAAAGIAGVTEQSWIRFEKRGEPFDLKVMQQLENYGFDMMYVIFGVPKTLKPDQHVLIGLYDKADEIQKVKIIQMAQLMIQSE